MSDHTDTYHFFWSGPFSQWQACRFEMDGLDFSSAEQAMMYFKATLFSDQEIADQILAEGEPGRQKALGRRVKGFHEETWAAERYDIVKRVNLAKFGQNKGLRRKLFQTIPKDMVEASPLDTIWGIGLDTDHALRTPVADWPGQNLLGRILNETRAELAETYPDEAKACAGENQETEND